MKKIELAALMSAFVSAPAIAAETRGNVGANCSTDAVFGIQGELDISTMANNASISVQAFLKNFSQDLGTNNTWGTTAPGFAGIYDFSPIAKLDKKSIPVRASA